MIKFFQTLSIKQKFLLSLLIIGMLLSSALEIIGLSMIIPIVYSLSENNFFENFKQFIFLKEYFIFETKLETLVFFLSFFLFCIFF